MIVSYNGDLRGTIEDLGHGERDVRCSVSSFSHAGACVDRFELLATVPALVAPEIRVTRPDLRTAELPFDLTGGSMELLLPWAVDEDEAMSFVRSRIVRIAEGVSEKAGAGGRRRRSRKH